MLRKQNFKYKIYKYNNFKLHAISSLRANFWHAKIMHPFQNLLTFFFIDSYLAMGWAALYSAFQVKHRVIRFRTASKDKIRQSKVRNTKVVRTSQNLVIITKGQSLKFATESNCGKWSKCSHTISLLQFDQEISFLSAEIHNWTNDSDKLGKNPNLILLDSKCWPALVPWMKFPILRVVNLRLRSQKRFRSLR